MNLHAEYYNLNIAALSELSFSMHSLYRMKLEKTKHNSYNSQPDG